MTGALTVFFLLLGQGPAAASRQPEPRFEAQLLGRVAIGYGVAVGDVDGDHKPDVLLADKKRFVWYRNGDWKRFVLTEKLTRHDNVCIAARDIDGDGRVEIAVGAQWNPGETRDGAKSGSVHYLARPEDATQPWRPIALHHEPTVHRMRWRRGRDDTYQLVVVPLHGRGNERGKGAGVRILAYDVPKDRTSPWTTHLLDDTLHLTHNFDVVNWDDDPEEEILVAGAEGVLLLDRVGEEWRRRFLVNQDRGGAGEVRLLRARGERRIATIAPMHGSELVLYALREGKPPTSTSLLKDLAQGHALRCADLFGQGQDQIVVGWRSPNAEKKVGVRLLVPGKDGKGWTVQTIDEDMACEDLEIADLNGDGRPDIIAAGRATRNLKIYWNRKP